MRQLRSHPLRTTALLVTGLAALAACADTGPDRIEGDTTVRVHEEPAEDEVEVDEGPVGTSFTEVELPDIEGDVGDGVDLNGGAPLTENAGMQGFLNPNLAQNLRADPGQTAKGAIEGLVTFGDLSLVGVDLDDLLDYIYKPGTPGAERFRFPDAVQEKAGTDRAIIGYMLPLEYKPRTNDIISFMLVRDLAACCFGGIPRPDEWIHVTMEEGKTTKAFRYVPIVVRGEFNVGRMEDEYGYAMGVYNLTAESVELYSPAKAGSGE